jgi:hypothetical protein
MRKTLDIKQIMDHILKSLILAQNPNSFQDIAPIFWLLKISPSLKSEYVLKPESDILSSNELSLLLFLLRLVEGTINDLLLF